MQVSDGTSLHVKLEHGFPLSEEDAAAAAATAAAATAAAAAAAAASGAAAAGDVAGTVAGGAVAAPTAAVVACPPIPSAAVPEWRLWEASHNGVVSEAGLLYTSTEVEGMWAMTAAAPTTGQSYVALDVMSTHDGRMRPWFWAVGLVASSAASLPLKCVIEDADYPWMISVLGAGACARKFANLKSFPCGS